MNPLNLRVRDWANDFAGHSHHERIGRDLCPFGNDRSGGDDRMRANFGAAQNQSANTDQDVILHDCAVHDRAVSHRYAITDTRRKAVINVNCAIVLDVCAFADHDGLAISAHDCAEGGLAVALAECCVAGGKNLGATVELSTGGVPPHAFLFGEDATRAIVSFAAGDAAKQVLRDTLSALGLDPAAFRVERLALIMAYIALRFLF